MEWHARRGARNPGDHPCLIPLATLAIGLLSVSLFPSGVSAQEQDLIGVYFDAAGSIDRTVTSAPYEPVSCYLILEQPSAPAGVLGWECIVEMFTDGTPAMSAWTLSGSAINIDTPPRFSVGLGAPLPWSETIILATGTIFVPEVGQEVEIYLHSYDPPSLVDPPGAGYPVYAPLYSAGDDPDLLLPLGWTAGCEGDPVAIINDDAMARPKELSISPLSLDFGSAEVGVTVTRELVISNSTPLILSGSLGVDSEFFTLRLPGDLVVGHLQVQLRPGQSRTVVAQFRPTAEGYYSTEITFAQCDEVIATIPCIGISLPPECHVDTDTLDFGTIPIFSEVIQTFTISNLGGGTVSGFASEDCPHYSFAANGGYFSLEYGESRAVAVRFEPTIEGEFTCTIDLGTGECDKVFCIGVGESFPPACQLTPEALDYGTRIVGTITSLTFVIENIGGEPFSGHVPNDCDVFHVSSGAGSFYLFPTESRQVTVGFLPTHEGTFTCDLDLGTPICGAINLTGDAYQNPDCRIIPDVLDFGTVAVGHTKDLGLIIRNAGGGQVSGIVPTSCGDFQTIAGMGSYSLGHEETRAVIMRFAPTDIGDHSCSLDLDVPCSDVPLIGIGSPSVCLIEPPALDFGEVETGSDGVLTFIINNVGNDNLTGVVPIGCDAFEVVSGAGPFDLSMGEDLPVQVRFTPDTLGAQGCVLDLEGICDDVPLSGTGVLPSDCTVIPTAIDFGLVSVGSSACETIHIINTGLATLEGTVSLIGDHFEIVLGAGPYSLAPADTHRVEVCFSPPQNNLYSCVVNTGSSECSSVSCQGLGTFTTSDPDVFGLYFDEFGIENLGFFEWGAPISMYLCLLNASEPTGASGWECMVEWTGDPGFITWMPRGNALNVSTPPEFTVGLSQPMPWQPSIVLMEFVIIPVSRSTHEFYLHPVSFPSIPGRMIYAAGANPGLLIPVEWSSGDELVSVAILNIDGPLGTQAEAPLARVSGGGVSLNWSCEADVDGFHVYRRAGSEPVERLTTSPVIGSGGRAEFLDPAHGIASGTVLRYSYGMLREGVEFARSPEIEVTLIGAVPSQTVLHPNYPNPFNPVTNIAFELRLAGHVRLEVFDIAGRKVCTLADENLTATRHERQWFGKDDSGRPVPSGAYYCRLETGGTVAMHKMVLLK